MTLNKKQDKAAKYLLFILISLLLAYTLWSHLSYEKKFSDNSIKKDYAIGTITSFSPGAKTPPTFDYEFNVNGKYYSSVHDIVSPLGQKSSNELKKYIGKKYTIWYVIDDPNFSQLLIEKPINEK